jgi:hypothetical protein
VTAQSTVLAVRLRQAQWLLDDLAFDAGSDRLDSARIAEAATTLSRLTLLLTSIQTTIADDEHPGISAETDP